MSSVETGEIIFLMINTYFKKKILLLLPLSIHLHLIKSHVNMFGLKAFIKGWFTPTTTTTATRKYSTKTNYTFAEKNKYSKDT